MKAKAGDRLVVKGHQVGERERSGEVVEVFGEHGEPPFRVRWSDDGHESTLFPGPDAVVEAKRKSR